MTDRQFIFVLLHQLYHAQPHWNFRRSNKLVKEYAYLRYGIAVVSGLLSPTPRSGVRVLRNRKRKDASNLRRSRPAAR